MKTQPETVLYVRGPMTRRRFLQFSAMGVGAAALAACAVPAEIDTGAAPADDTAADSADAVAADAEPTTMVWMGHQEVSGLAPDDLGPTVHEVILYNIYNPLVYYNEKAELENVLAESYEVSEDGLTYTFNLNQGVLFHNGDELTAEDVVYTFDFYRDEEFASARVGDFNGIESVEAVDDYTVQVNMAEVNAASLSQWGEFPIVNAALHQEIGHEGYRTEPIGTGAYQLVEFNPAEFVELEAFADHFRGAPGFQTLRQDVVPENSTRFQALQAGDADSSVWPLLNEDSLELAADEENFTTFITLINSVKHFPLNNTLPQFQDVRVRRAMMHALDRERIIEDLWQGSAEVATGNLTPKNVFYYNPDVPVYDFNPEGAMALLDEAGFTPGDDGVRVNEEGTRLSFTCTTITGDQARRPIAELAQQFLGDVGIEMNLEEAPVSAILEGLRNSTMDCSLFNWTYGSTPEPDPFSTLHTDGGNNFASYSNPDMDALIEQGVSTTDADERKEIYYQIQQLFAEEVPVLYLQFDESYNIFTERVANLPDVVLSSDPVYYAAYRYDQRG